MTYKQLSCLTYFFAQSDSRIFVNLNLYLMKTAHIPVYRNIAVYGYVLNY